MVTSASQSLSSSILPQMPSEQKVSFRNDLFYLADSIEETWSPTIYDIILKDCSNTWGGHLCLGSLLCKIHDIFSKIFSFQTPLQPSYSIVLGLTGSGKSALIGHQLAGPLCSIKRVSCLGRDIEGEVDYFKASQALPKISHTNSQTKGYDIFQHYIDTGGYKSTSGWEDELCSRMAVRIAINRLSPNRVIFPVETNGSFSDYGVDYLANLVETTLKNPLKSLRPTLFVITKPKDMTSEQDVLKWFKWRSGDLHQYLISEFKKALYPDSFMIDDFDDELEIEPISDDEELHDQPNYSSSSVIHEGPKELHTVALEWLIKFDPAAKDAEIRTEGENAFLEMIEKLHHINKKKFHCVMNQLKFINQMMQAKFIIGDFTKAETREQILEWESTHGSLSTEDFILDDPSTQNHHQFKTLLLHLSQYFMNSDRSQEELEKYRDYCHLLVNIIRGLRLDHTDNEDENAIFTSFCERFDRIVIHPMEAIDK